MELKQCKKCLDTKPLDLFYNSSQSKDGKMSYCKACSAAHNKEWQKKNPERARERWRIAEKKSRNPHRSRAKRYGLTIEELDVILLPGMCQICKKTKDDARLHVDHDHVTGVVRGLLCHSCNTGIGSLGDSVELLQEAIKYLTRLSSSKEEHPPLKRGAEIS